MKEVGERFRYDGVLFVEPRYCQQGNSVAIGREKERYLRVSAVLRPIKYSSSDADFAILNRFEGYDRAGQD